MIRPIFAHLSEPQHWPRWHSLRTTEIENIYKVQRILFFTITGPSVCVCVCVCELFFQRRVNKKAKKINFHSQFHTTFTRTPPSPSPSLSLLEDYSPTQIASNGPSKLLTSSFNQNVRIIYFVGFSSFSS